MNTVIFVNNMIFINKGENDEEFKIGISTIFKQFLFIALTNFGPSQYRKSYMSTVIALSL